MGTKRPLCIDDIAQAKRSVTQGFRQSATLVESGRLEVALIQAENALIMLKQIIKEKK